MFLYELINVTNLKDVFDHLFEGLFNIHTNGF